MSEQTYIVSKASTDRARSLEGARCPNSRTIRRFDYIRRHDANFAQFFLRYHHLPYDNWSRLSHDDLDFVIRFEHLQEDFAGSFAQIGLELKRPLPVTNRTEAKDSDYLKHYTPEIFPRARRVYGPYMRSWGYEFPAEWGEDPVPNWHDMLYEALAFPRTLYWRWLRRTH